MRTNWAALPFSALPLNLASHERSATCAIGRDGINFAQVSESFSLRLLWSNFSSRTTILIISFYHCIGEDGG